MRNAIVMTALAVVLAAGLAIAQSPPVARQAQAGGEASVTGKIVSIDPQQLVILADTGRMTFVLEPTTEKPTNLQVDDQVTVHYRPGEQGMNHIALRIEAADKAVPDNGSRAAATRDSSVDAARERPDVASGARDDAAAKEREPGAPLPRTASRLPIIGLIGLLSLLGAVGLRLVSRPF